MSTAPGTVTPSSVPAKVKALWRSAYPPEVQKRQQLEGFLLLLGTVLAVALTLGCWSQYSGSLRFHFLALLGGLLGGLLHAQKYFYKSVGESDWIWDKGWWRLLTPFGASVMGMSIYLVFRAGTFIPNASAQLAIGPPNKEDYYAYGLGFLTGLFADNALQKLRDIAYTLFGPTQPSKYKKLADEAKEAELNPHK